MIILNKIIQIYDKEVINGTKVPSIKSLLDRVDWNWISDGWL